MTTHVVEVTPDEGAALLDAAARDKRHISGEEFLRRYDAGELDREDLAVLDVEILVPFARRQAVRGRHPLPRHAHPRPVLRRGHQDHSQSARQTAVGEVHACAPTRSRCRAQAATRCGSSWRCSTRSSTGSLPGSTGARSLMPPSLPPTGDAR